MNEPSKCTAQEGDELWFGLIGPIRVSDAITPERIEWSEAARVAQAAHTLTDLAALVASHPDWRVRHEAVPRLRARFPYDPLTLQTLAAASRDPEAAVRDTSVFALGDLREPAAADLVYERLVDEDLSVRHSAALTLAYLGDPRAPDDAEAWALQGMLDPPH